MTRLTIKLTMLVLYIALIGLLTGYKLANKQERKRERELVTYMQNPNKS